MGEEMKGRAAEMRTVDESVFFFPNRNCLECLAMDK